MFFKLVFYLMLVTTSQALEMRGLQTIVNILNGDFFDLGKGHQVDNMTADELGQSKGHCFYDFIDHVGYRYDRECSLYDNEIAHLLASNLGNSDRKPPIKMKCLPDMGNGTLIIPETLKDIVSLLKPVGNATKRSEEGSCVLILFFTNNCYACTWMAPAFNVLPKFFPTFRIAAIDVNKFSSFNAEFGIVGLPTVLLFHQGRPIVKFYDEVKDFVSFLTKHTGIKAAPYAVLSQILTFNDVEQPLLIKVVDTPDYYLILAWTFILFCVGNYFAKSQMCLKIVEMIKRNWHESEVQLEQVT